MVSSTDLAELFGDPTSCCGDAPKKHLSASHRDVCDPTLRAAMPQNSPEVNGAYPSEFSLTKQLR